MYASKYVKDKTAVLSSCLFFACISAECLGTTVVWHFEDFFLFDELKTRLKIIQSKNWLFGAWLQNRHSDIFLLNFVVVHETVSSEQISILIIIDLD